MDGQTDDPERGEKKALAEAEEVVKKEAENAAEQEEKARQFKIRQARAKQRSDTVQATNDTIQLIIDGLPYDQREFDTLLNDISSANGDWFMTWVEENFTITTPEGVEPEDCEIDWA